jgi:hypothetical protein
MISNDNKQLFHVSLCYPRERNKQKILYSIAICLLYTACSQQTKNNSLYNGLSDEIKLQFMDLALQINCTDTVSVLPGSIYSQEIKTPTKEEEHVLAEIKNDWAKQISYSHPLYSYKVDSLVKEKLKWTQYNGYDGANTINIFGHKTIEGLNAKELIYYCTAYPGSFSQNCSNLGWTYKSNNCFYPFLPTSEETRNLSSLQKGGLRNHRKKVCYELTNYFTLTDIIEVSVLQIIEDARLIEMIPVLCNKADFKKNTLCFTVLNQLMNSSNYRPYYNSAFYLNRQNDNAYSIHPASEKEASELKDLAMAYYKLEIQK